MCNTISRYQNTLLCPLLRLHTMPWLYAFVQKGEKILRIHIRLYVQANEHDWEISQYILPLYLYFQTVYTRITWFQDFKIPCYSVCMPLVVLIVRFYMPWLYALVQKGEKIAHFYMPLLNVLIQKIRSIHIRSYVQAQTNTI